MSRLCRVILAMVFTAFFFVIGILLGAKAPSVESLLLISFMAAWVNDKK